jgi:hypothetical protein
MRQKPVKEFLLHTRVKNNLLYEKIFSNYESVAEFCRLNNLHNTEVGKLLNLKVPVYTKRGLSPTVLRLVEVFNCPIEDLFPEQQFDGYLETNLYV